MSDGYRTLLGKVDVTAVAEAVDEAVKRQERLTSCDYVHPQYDVHHPEGHPENGTF